MVALGRSAYFSNASTSPMSAVSSSSYSASPQPPVGNAAPPPVVSSLVVPLVVSSPVDGAGPVLSALLVVGVSAPVLVDSPPDEESEVSPGVPPSPQAAVKVSAARRRDECFKVMSARI